MRSLTLASALLASSSLVFSLAIQPRVEDYPDEAVWIMECLVTGQTVSTTQDYLWWFNDFDSVVAKGRKPDDKAYARLPAGHPKEYEHIDWTLATDKNRITATFPDQGNFWVYGLAKEGDSKTHVTGKANLNGNDMRCYTSPKAKSKSTQSYGKEECTSVYICTRTNREIKRTVIEVSNEMLEVQMKGMDARELQAQGLAYDPAIEQKIIEAFGHLQNGRGFDIFTSIDPKFDDYKLKFDLDMGDKEADVQYDETKIPRIAEELKKFAPKLAKSALMGSCGSWSQTTGKGSDCWWKVPFPKEIRVKVQTALQQTQKWKSIDRITVTTMKGNCSPNAALSVLLTGVFSAGAAALTGGASAVVAGIGAVVAESYAASC